ncbi:hypothetical protein SteCoe_35691 [Stentor coeruleus]|uniref:Uncharacterized protein n=1 Tax=Stentor coeruleus TaxID=5963 RepID=A0A1R2ARP7_9CILI|nr:hypothetical protein SteCoe_35691 [Stentor coeruleus]
MERPEKANEVQKDKFWTWRVNREENLMMKEFDYTQERDANQIRLMHSVEKAREVAAKIRKRPADKSTSTD